MSKVKKLKNSLPSWLISKPVLLGIIVVLLAAAVWYSKAKDDSGTELPVETTGETGANVNLDPPTKEEKQQAEDNKKSLEESTPIPNRPSAGKVKVEPIISFADHNEVRAFVPGIFEDGGKCTATATSGSQTRSATSSGFADVNKTSCKPIQWTLPSGQWTVVVSYSSSTSAGKSKPETVD